MFVALERQNTTVAKLNVNMRVKHYDKAWQAAWDGCSLGREEPLFPPRLTIYLSAPAPFSFLRDQVF